MNPESSVPIRRALLSVSNKNGLFELAAGLHALGVELLSTGGTARSLREAGFVVREVSDVTGFPELMDGRVKTLHPKIHGGLLGRAQIDEEVMEAHGIEAIDLLVINLYPFEEVVRAPNCRLEEAVENIDIGGPAMLRAAAKNFARVSVLSDPSQYQKFLFEINQSQGASTQVQRFELAVAGFNRVAQYDAAISNYLSASSADGKQLLFPAQQNSNFIKVCDLRYGENPHQSAAFYRDLWPVPGTLATMEFVQGKELSYNNLADADAAWECVRQFEQPACVIVKHANPCGVAMAENINRAYHRAYQTDSSSAFGGIIAFNRKLDPNTASDILNQQFVEVIIAPSIDPLCLSLLAKKPNIRVIKINHGSGQNNFDVKRVGSGLLMQTADIRQLQAQELSVVSKRVPDASQLQDLKFAWQVAKYVKSNAIVYAKDCATIGVGAGQMSRVMSAKIAGLKASEAELAVQGSVMASDAFFPFRDGIDAAAQAGIVAVIQPGGSMRDAEVITAANEHNIAMVFTGVRHFRH